MRLDRRVVSAAFISRVAVAVATLVAMVITTQQHQRRKGNLSVPGASEPACLRADSAGQGERLFRSQAGIDVNFAVGRGGVDVAKQVGAGNAPLGGIVADGPIMVRQNGVPIKIVAIFGGRGFMQLVVREDSGIEKPADLKGKTISVMSFQDTTYYALLGSWRASGSHKTI